MSEKPGRTIPAGVEERGVSVRLVRREELDQLERHLAAVVDRTLSPSAGDGLENVVASLKSYVLGGGKRIRPQLCLWTCGHFDVDGPWRHRPQGGVLDLACAWELFHAFLLAHDDIIDNGDVRRDQPSLHRRLAELDSGCRMFGVNLAIIGGDLLFAAAMSLLHELELPPERYRAVLKLFSRVAAQTGLGQAIDLLQGHVPLDDVREEALLREYGWKTAVYTFEGPMLSGAIAAGADAACQAAISRFALALGQAYQLQNDLLDLSVPAHSGCDLVQGKRTVTLMRARAAMSPEQRRRLEERLARAMRGDEAGVAEAERLRQELLSGGAAAMSAVVVGQLLTEAEAAAGDTALPVSLRSGLCSLLGRLRESYFRDAAAVASDR